jgi:competence protein ComEC
MDTPTAPAGPDLRLVGVAVGTWMSALAGLHISAWAGAIVAVGAGLAAAVLLWLSQRTGPSHMPVHDAVRRIWSRAGAGWLARRRSVATRVMTGVLLGMSLGAAATAARAAERDADPLAALAQGRATVRAEFVVSDDPRAVPAMGGRPSTVAVDGRLRRLWTERGTILSSARILVLAGDPDWRDLLPGQRVQAAGRLTPARGGDLTAAVISTGDPPVRLGRPPWLQVAAGSLRAGLQMACEPLPDDPGGLLPGLVIGDTSRLPQAVADDFRATGMTHLVAVSGLNFVDTDGLTADPTRLSERLAAGSGSAASGAVLAQ